MGEATGFGVSCVALEVAGTEEDTLGCIVLTHVRLLSVSGS